MNAQTERRTRALRLLARWSLVSRIAIIVAFVALIGLEVLGHRLGWGGAWPARLASDALVWLIIAGILGSGTGVALVSLGVLRCPACDQPLVDPVRPRPIAGNPVPERCFRCGHVIRGVDSGKPKQ